MCAFSDENETQIANNCQSVQNLIKKFEQFKTVPMSFKVQTKKKSLSANMTEDSNNIVPTLNQNIVNKFFQNQKMGAYNSSEVNPKSAQTNKKRSDSLRPPDNKPVEKKSSFMTKYFRNSFSNSKKSGAPKVISQWYASEEPKKQKKDFIKKEPKEIPTKPFNEKTKETENCNTENIIFRRKTSYKIATRRSFTIDVDTEEPQIEEMKSIKTPEIENDVDEEVKKVYRKVKITKENQENLNFSINEGLLKNFKNIKPEKEEIEEVEYINLVYNEDDGKLTKYSGEECANMKQKYWITFNETPDPEKIEEIQVINGTVSEFCAKNSVQHLCDKIQEQLNDVIKTIECESEGGAPEETIPKRNIFEFWRQQSEINTPKTRGEDVTPNITNKRRSNGMFSSLSSKSLKSEETPTFNRINSCYSKRRSHAIEEPKVEATKSFLKTLRNSFKASRENVCSRFDDKKEENKTEERRNSYLNKRKSTITLSASQKIEPERKTKSEDNILSKVVVNKKENKIEAKRNSIPQKITKTKEKTPKNDFKEVEICEVNKKAGRQNNAASSSSHEIADILKPNQLYMDMRNLVKTEENNSKTTTIRSSSLRGPQEQRHSRLYSGSFRSALNKDKPETPEKDTPRLSRLYNSNFKYKKTDDNNNNCETTKKKSEETTILQFESDTEDDFVEICNPFILDDNEDHVQATVKHLEKHNVVRKDAKMQQSVDNGIKTCTVFDEQNNPAIRLSIYEILLDVNEEDNAAHIINQSEKQYRESIEYIQNNSQLACLIAELKSTEHNYVKKSLCRLVTDYMPEMSKHYTPPTLVGKARVIFGNADILYQNHKLKFLPDLEAAKNVDEIAECFLKYEEKIFQYYPLYTKNKPNSEKLMRDYANNFFKRKQDELQDRLDLSSYLLTPIQRMAKYCQLVKGMAKECDKEGKPSEKLYKASEMLSKLMSKGNDLIALESIKFYDGDLRQEGDLLLRDTFLVQPPHRRQSYEGMIFLFQESILITQIKRQNGSEYFEYQDSIKLCDMGYTDNQAEPLVFKIWYRKRDQKNYIIRSNKKEQQQKWVKEIFNLLWKQLEANKMRKKKEYEESGLHETTLLVTRPISEPNNKNSFKNRFNSSMKKKKSESEAIWYSKMNFDFSQS